MILLLLIQLFTFPRGPNCSRIIFPLFNFLLILRPQDFPCVFGFRLEYQAMFPPPSLPSHSVPFFTAICMAV